MFPKVLTFALLLNGLLAGLVITSAQAQGTETPQTHEGSAADLRITPRFSADFNTPRNGDNGQSFSRVNAFFPLIQTPGHHLTFLSTGARLDSNGNLGGNVSLGHRLALDENTILGGYVAYDLRNTERRTFNQLGLGTELLGTNWNAHINGYIPIGTSSAQVGGITDTNQLINTFFQNNQLFLVTGGLQEFESALGGIDAGAGLQLGNFGSYGTLWGYGNVYYLADSLGGSLRLNHHLGNSFQVGLGVQSDGIFGTQVFFSVGSSFGGVPHTALSAENDNEILSSPWAQAATEITRNPSIVVQQEVRGVPSQTLVAIDPATGQPYSFRHVNPNSVSPNQGDGTIASPFTTLGTSAADVANTGLRNVSAGEILYVRAGDSLANNLTPFTIPASVQVYSEAIAQTLSTQLGTVTLPGSGTGVRPLVNGGGGNGITLIGGNNLLSGFEVTNSSNGIFANNAPNAVIQNNIASGNIQTGISANNSANAIIQNNIVNNNLRGGIRVSNQAGATVRNNQLDNNRTADFGVNANVAALFLLNVTGTVAVDSNTVTGTRVGPNAGFETLEGLGIALANTTAGTVDLTLSNNTVTGSQGDGILASLIGLATNQGSFTLINNTIQNNGGTSPLRGDGIKVSAEGASRITNLLIEGNTISGNLDDGIDVSLNQIIGAARLNNGVIRNHAIINDNGGQGIILRSGSASRMQITVEDNAINNNASDGVRAQSTGISQMCLALRGNTSNDGYRLVETSGTFRVVDRDGVSAGNTGTVTFTPGVGSFGTVTDIANCP